MTVKNYMKKINRPSNKPEIYKVYMVSNIFGDDIPIRQYPCQYLNGHEVSVNKQADTLLNYIQILYTMDCPFFSQAACKPLSNLLPTVNNVLRSLRSKIFPKDMAAYVAQAFYRTYFYNEESLNIYAILASETAEKEAPYFLSILKNFSSILPELQIHLLIVQWESKTSYNNNKSNFPHIVRSIRDLIQSAQLTNVAILPLSLDYDREGRNIISPLLFKKENTEVLKAYSCGASAQPSILKDLLWAINFYARQESLRHYGAQRAIIDLSIRRGIGATIKQLINNSGKEEQAHHLILTSELNKRILPCYNIDFPILNISTSFATTKG
jgi:hypothetical protein